MVIQVKHRQRCFLFQTMKKEIHPEYFEDTEVTCSCGAKFTVGSTKKKMSVEICSKCHPIYTGKEREIKTGMEKYYNSHGNSYTSIPAVTYNQHLMSALRIDLGEQENFRFEIVHSEANGRTGYIIYAILTTIGLQDYASSDVGDQSVFFFPSKLNSDWEKAEWAKGWNDDSFFD